jgi:N12 class adenine-specific DNA methylase
VCAGTAADGATIKEGSYLLGNADQLTQIVDGEARAVTIRSGSGSDGIFARNGQN